MSSVAHEGFGGLIPPPPLRYLGLMLTELPPVPLFGLIVGLTYLAARIYREGASRDLGILTLSVALVTTWCGILSVSPKEGWRYAIPSLPFMYLIAGYGIVSLLSKLLKEKREAITFGCLAALVLHLQSPLSVAPFFESYVNPLTTDTATMIRRNQLRPLVGQNELVETLLQEATKGSTTVAVVGDGLTIETAVQRKNPILAKRLLIRYLHPESSDLFLAFPSERPFRAPYAEFNSAEPLFSRSLAGIELFALFRVPTPTYRDPFFLPLGAMVGEGGKVVRGGEGSSTAAIEAEPEINKPGNLILYPIGIRSPESSILVEIVARTPPTTPDEAVVGAFNLARNCKTLLRGRDLRGKPLSFTCKAPLPKKLGPQLTWKGKFPIRVEQISLKGVQ